MLAAVRTHGVDAVITRGANTYGTNQYPEKLVPLFVTNAIDGEALPLYGDGRQKREWLHARITARRSTSRSRRLNRRGLQRRRRGARERVDPQRILELTGADESLVRHVDDRPGHDRRYSLDDSKLRALGWSPAHALAEGLAETVAWYRDNRAWWEPIKSGAYREYYEQQYAARLAT